MPGTMRRGVRPKRWREWLAIAGLAFALFGRGLGFGFVWDDHDLIETNRAVSGEGALRGWASLLGSGFAASPFAPQPGPYYRPLSTWTLALDHAAWKGRPAGFHATNLALHAAASVALLEWLAATGLGAWPRLAGAALFAAHPVHVEPVAWISGRTDLLATLAGLLALLAWRRAREPGPGRRRGLAAGLSVAFLAAALLAKEMALAIPLVMVVQEAVRRPGLAGRARGRTAAGGRRLSGDALPVNTLPLLGAVAAVTLVYLALRAHALGGMEPGRGAEPWGTRLLTAPFIVVRATALLAWPARLDPVHAPAEIASPADPRFLASLAALAALFALLAMRRELRRAILEPVLFLLVTLTPVVGLVPLVVPFAERFLYLPSVAFAWLAAIAVDRARGTAGHRRRAAVVAMAALVIGAAAARSWTQLPVWRDDTSLFGAIVARHPDSVPALSELAIASREARGVRAGAGPAHARDDARARLRAGALQPRTRARTSRGSRRRGERVRAHAGDLAHHARRGGAAGARVRRRRP
jgi:protein O-mannosyl-transferase